MLANSHNLRTGKKGEIIAADYLRKTGYHIIAQNYRAGRGEIDLVASKDETIVFVEVKTRNSRAYGFPEQSVGEKKIAMLKETAAEYLAESGWQGPIRFDIVAIDLSGRTEISHFEDAFF